MSTRVDTASLISGACVVGNRGLGVSAAQIRAATAAGDHGPGLLYNEWDDSADDAKELRLLVESPPSSGALFVDEDGSFTLAGAEDGSYTLGCRVFADGADLGSTSATITIGDAPASGGGIALVGVSSVGGGVAFEFPMGGSAAVVEVNPLGGGAALEVAQEGSGSLVSVLAVGGGTEGAVGPEALTTPPSRRLRIAADLRRFRIGSDDRRLDIKI